MGRENGGRNVGDVDDIELGVQQEATSAKVDNPLDLSVDINVCSFVSRLLLRAVALVDEAPHLQL